MSSSHEGKRHEDSIEYRRVKNSATTSTALSRIGTFLATLAAIFFFFVAKRYDLDEVVELLGLGSMSTLPGVSRPGMPSNDGTLNHGYSICTRSRDGIYTVEKRGDKEEQPHHSQCLMVDQAGLITHVGSIDSVKALNPATRIRFLPPKAVVLPGLVDSHVHLLEYGWSRSLNLEGTRNVAQVVERVRNYILSRPSSVGQEEWIEGVGWDQNLWEDWSGGFPTHDILDADPILRGKPIILFRVDLHAMWLSGRALELCGELPEKAEGGEIIRDSDGKPTGVFLDNAQLLVPRPDWSESQMREFFERGTKDLLKWGVTAVHDAMSRDSAVKFYQKMADEGILPVSENAPHGIYGRGLLEWAGGRITLGSDMPVESGNPLVTFHAAVTRVDANGDSPQGPGGWYPEEKLTRMQSLKGMTIDAAYASFSEHEVGSLEAGKRADFVVLDRDIMSVDGQEILKTKVLATVVDGVIQFGSF
ncbi:hypothetical protein FRC14_000622 [Serendipita sp. 396]|nr:hypothetical protein FRC14_000622 [Serendipita sp. 396]